MTPTFDSYAHRMAVGRRFGSRIATGDAVFLREWRAEFGVPHTVVDGEKRSLTGLNRLVLMQVMQDRGWTDSRFFTSDQITREGWHLRENAKPIGLQFMVSVDDDGLVLQVPIVKRFHVFNANEIEGVGKPLVDSLVPLVDVTQALSQVGISIGTHGIGAALEDWAKSLHESDEMASKSSQDGASSLDTLCVRLAASLVLSEIGLTAQMSDSSQFVQAWAQQVQGAPLMFCEAVNVAQSLASAMILGIRSAGLERSASAELATLRKAAMGASPRVEALFVDPAAVLLAVPFVDKDLAKQMGAIWYGPESVWFVPKGVDVGPFERWLPKVSAMSLSPDVTREVQLESFRKEMLALGLADPGDVIDDGAWHNVPVTTKVGTNKSGSYIVSLKGGRYGQPIGTIMNKHTGQSFTWTHVGASLTPEQRAKARAESMAREALVAAESLRVQDLAAVHAQEIWKSADAAVGHGYVLKKGISPIGLRQVSGSVLLGYPEFVGESGGSAIRGDQRYLLVPMSNRRGELRALQAISANGVVKSFMRGAQKKGTMAVLGAESFDSLLDAGLGTPVAFGEGVATMASFRSVTGCPVVVCFDAGNLEVVATALIPDLASSMVPLIALDNDQFHLERALGFAVEKVGVTPVASAVGSALSVVADGIAALRGVELGGLIVDGQWHQAAGGKFCAKCEVEGGAVRSISLDVVPANGDRMVSASFSNRGLEAGRKVQALCAEGELPRSVRLASPVFSSLEGRPTDWNDLVQREGVEAAREVLRAVLPVGLLNLPPVVPSLPERPRFVARTEVSR